MPEDEGEEEYLISEGYCLLKLTIKDVVIEGDLVAKRAAAKDIIGLNGTIVILDGVNVNNEVYEYRELIGSSL